MAAKEQKPSGDQDDLSFLRTEDYICLNCSVITQNGINRRMALAAEAFGNKMCFLEDITLENVTPDFPACIFVLEQSLSVRALQEVVNSAHNSSANAIIQSGGHKTLLYGHAVLLRHLQSNMYLTCLSTSTSNDKLAFDVGLQHNSQGESCWWTIHPASKQRSEGEKVRVGDDIILVSVASERYLHIYTVDSMIHRVNASFQQTLWTLLPLSSGNIRYKTTGYVYGGEVLRLFHGNMDQCFTLPQPGVSEQPYSIFYETGTACNHARSLWRLEYMRTRWYGGFMNWSAYVRIRHVTSGRYLGMMNGEVCVIHKDKATGDAITFVLVQTKDDKKTSSAETDLEENMGKPVIKYGETLVYIQHAKSLNWLSYQTYETKKRGVGKIEEKKAVLHAEGHMDDCFTIVRAQDEEARSALVIRKCMSLFTKFIRAMDQSVDETKQAYLASRYWKKISLEKVSKCLEDLIEFFAQPSESCSHEERQNKLKALRNRQDLFHEEGMISLVLETIDKYSDTKEQATKTNVPLFEGYRQQFIDDIYDQLYALLAVMIKGNRNNCAQFAQGSRLDSLISRLTSQQTSRGVLEVLQCILIDSPEALNMIKERHIQGIISLLDRNGRDPKVLTVLSSLCANNGIAVRTNQNLICENLLPRRDLILQTRLIEQISCLRPNIMVGVVHGESMYKKWYFEVEVDFIETMSASSSPPHCRIGWANTEFQPTPAGSDGFSPVGVGDDVNSYGFDGTSLWFAGRNKLINSEEFAGFKKGDVIGCLLDLSIPEIWFSLNGVPMKGFFREFNLSSMFYPCISVSPKISCRFLFGDDHGRFKYGPPEGCAPIYQAMLHRQKIKLELCFSFGDSGKQVFHGAAQPLEQVAFTPAPVDIVNVLVPGYIENVRDKLAENLHEIWAASKIEQGWRYSDFRDDNKKLHNCLTQFEMLPKDEKTYDTNLAMDTLKTIFAMGYKVLLENRQDQRRLKLIKLPIQYMQINGYKPQPLDLNNVALTPQLDELVELLAENTHNVWAKELIKNGWTYGVVENPVQKRHPYLLPYDKVDAPIKKRNRETALDTVKTLLAYGYLIEPPTQDLDDPVHKKSAANTSKDNSLSQKLTSRTYRAEKTYAISSGKWYYEVEILTHGSVKIGWSKVSCQPNTDISCDSSSYAFDCSMARKWHMGSEAFGKVCNVGDIVGVMIDFQDKNISFSLNGEFLLDSVGSEIAFEGINADDGGYVPAFTLLSGQKIRVNFGQDVNSLRYFTNCGLQEGYEPFAVNMTKAITFWYSDQIPIFQNIEENHDSLEIVTTNNDNTPCMKLTSKSFGSGKTKMEYLRLSLPVCFNEEFVSRSTVKEKRMNALALYKSQLEEEADNQQMFNFDQLDINFKSNDKMDYETQTSASTPSNSKQGKSSLLNKITKSNKDPGAARPKSPFKLLNKLSREPSPMTSQASTTKSKSSSSSKNAANNKSKISRSSEFGIKTIATGAKPSAIEPAPPSSRTIQKPGITVDDYAFSDSDSAYPMLESDDIELQAIIDYVDEYYYGVRLFPGQDGSKVYVGWTTSRFHMSSDKLERNFNLKDTSKCTLINTSSDGSIVSSLTRSECYVFSAMDLSQNLGDSEFSSSKIVTNSVLIGCMADLATGILSFTFNGKECVGPKVQVEPGTRLYPAVFVEPTTKEVLQFELGRVRNCLPLSAALFPSLGKHITPRCPPRLRLQFLQAIRWSRVPNTHLKVHCLKMNNILGWSLLCEEIVHAQAVFIPEEDRWINVLELNENHVLQEFFESMILLYEAVCDQSNNYVAHQICKMIDERQLFYCIQNQYMSGPLRKGFYDLLIKLHLESYVTSNLITKREYVVPLTPLLYENQLGEHDKLMGDGCFPNRDSFVSVRPSIISESEVKNETQKMFLIPPNFDLDRLKQFVLTSFCESVKLCASLARDPIGGTNSFLFVPLIKLMNKILIMNAFDENDLNMIMIYLDPQKFPNKRGHSINEGLLNLNLQDEIKYEICCLLNSMCDYILRFRIESVVCFSSDYVQELQSDQKKRYNELKASVLPSAIMAKKTKEFRCPAKDQMHALVNYKAYENSQIDLSDDIKNKLQSFHDILNSACHIKERGGEEDPDANNQKSNGVVSKVFNFLFSSNSDEEAAAAMAAESGEMSAGEASGDLESTEPEVKKNFNLLSQIITEHVIEWAKKSFINNEELIREMFFLVYRQYNALNEISDCLQKTYVIGESSIRDVSQLLQSLSTTRGLLCVQMSPVEEEIMKSCLNDIMDNKTFFQHPDLMRALCIHETVMQVMINWLNRRQRQQEVTGAGGDAGDQQAAANPTIPTASGEEEKAKEENTDLVVVCCKFLSYFCRTSRHNQRAMFEHLSYLLDNSAMLLSRPSLRGSCPLDVACSSLMDNNDLSLALRESDLEKIAAYLSRCGLQTNSELLAKGYPDIGWDPVEGERFLDFLKFCVWVNGDSVEENANLIVRLLIRRPECLGPALRGEGGGLLKATIDGIRMSLQIAATQNVQNPIVMASMLESEAEMSIDFMRENKFDFTRIPTEEDEDYIDQGGAILSFYASLVELLGRCAPNEELIKMGKSDSIRARSILRSLVSMEDLEGVLSLRFILPIPSQPALNERLPGIQTTHKMSIVLFLDRVYGIPDQETFFRLLETAFLPDIRCAIVLDSSPCKDSEAALALNRYLCNSVLPLLTSYSYYFEVSESQTSLMETVLNIVYRLSKCKSLTNGQLDVVCEFLIAFTNQMSPTMMKCLLPKLIEDLPTLEEYTIVPLKMLTLWYERCGKYYGSSPFGGLQASEEEKRLTMTLFTRIFDALAKRTYDPELFSKALPCLTAIGCSLPPDYSYASTSESSQIGYVSKEDQKENTDDPTKRDNTYDPKPIDTSSVTLTADFEEIIKSFSEHVHDLWCFNKIEQGWTYGEVYNDLEKVHPMLKSYSNLSHKDQTKYEEIGRETLKAMKILGWAVEKSDTGNTIKNASRLFSKKIRELKSSAYIPKPYDLSNITLTREQDDLAISLSTNYHHVWSKQKKQDLENVGASLHHLLVPYEVLTDSEKAKYLEFSFDMLKFLILNGYRIQNIELAQTESRYALSRAASEDEEKLITEKKNEIRFAYNLLEKLLEYVDKAAINMSSIKESSRYSHSDSFKTSGQDVKFFTKVVLPLIERYFQSNRSYFILKSNFSAGCATVKEKEMACSLFCKLALLMRKKLSCFGSDSNITVRCLQVLIRAVDVSSVIKNSQEIVRASLLPFFSYAADDLENLIEDMKSTRLSNLLGTSQKTYSTLDYVHMVLLPVLASMFDHLGANQYGADVLVGEIQLSSYKILNALWILGTTGTRLVDREWIIHELNRHRPLIGECLGSFANSFPIAFLEPEYNYNNKNCILYGMSSEANLSEQSLEGQDVMNKVGKNLPSLKSIVDEISSFCDSNGKYENAPHVIEVLLPMICSYLNYWWQFSPAAKQQQQADANTAAAKLKHLEKGASVEPTAQGSMRKPVQNSQQTQQPQNQPLAITFTDKSSEIGPITNVTADLMNQTLRCILKLISNNVDQTEASWMNRIAGFSQSIISTSTPALLERSFLPVSHKLAEKTKELYEREINIKSITRNVDSADRESIEGDLQRDFECLIRNLYAFYPLLIKFVDMHRAYWLKNPDYNSEQLYYHVAEVFNIWLRSKMFKREELNFVSANDIDNMLLIMPKGATAGPGAGSDQLPPNLIPPSADSKSKKKKGGRGSGGAKKKKFNSLIVACLKRLIQIGINFFEGKEQEIIQIAKQKFIDIKTGNFAELKLSAAKTKALQNAMAIANASASGNDDDNIELSKDLEDIVEDFIKKYMKTFEACSSDEASRSGDEDEQIQFNEAMDKETYQKTKWQRMLYRKIGKRHASSSPPPIANSSSSSSNGAPPVDPSQLIIQRIMEISKVLYGMHMVEHPPVKAKGTWRKLISSQRKRAVMACFRMAPLYSMSHHRAINLFLKSYKMCWLEVETENDTDLACLIPDLCPQAVKTSEAAEGEGSAEGATAVPAVTAGGEEGNKEGAGGAEASSGEAKSDGSKSEGGEGQTASSTAVEQTPDPLRQLIACFNRAATTEQGNTTNLADDMLYQVFSDAMSRSCEIIDDDDEEEAPPGGEEENDNTFKEAETLKQKLLFEQGRLAERGATEMCLFYISASRGEKTDMLEKTLQLGISLLHGGNTSVQSRMYNHLREKKDSGFFTSLAGLMANCSVLDLDTFERCIKAEQFGGGSAMAGKKNLHDADFTCSLFRFLQLLCEGHNLEFQNYLRQQTGNNIIVNTVICTVDYLLRLQDSMMDFYWHYSGKSTVDKAGKDNFCKAISVASQVFNTLTEYIQGPCVGNQETLAQSRLWDAIGGFLYIFANLQDKLSKDPHQIELLRELMNLQKDMIIMLLSMLEGNVFNGQIGRQMVDTLIENQQNVEMLLKFFDIFLKMKDLTTSEAFQEFDQNGDGWISPKEFKRAMEAQKMYTSEEIDYILMCVDTNQDGKIDFKERFHDPAKDIGFNMAVLLTNLSEHMSSDPRLDRLMKKASSFLAYFEPYLGRIEIQGSSGRIERVYFEITESNLEQWNKPQIKESKRQFLFDIVNESDEKEKLENFVNFCEDTIFEMQHAASISSEPSEQPAPEAKADQPSLVRQSFDLAKSLIFGLFYLLSPSYIQSVINSFKQTSKRELVVLAFRMLMNSFFFSTKFVFHCIQVTFRCLYLMVADNPNSKTNGSKTEPADVFGYAGSGNSHHHKSPHDSGGSNGSKDPLLAESEVDPESSGVVSQDLELYRQSRDEPEAKETSSKSKINYQKLLEENEEEAPSASVDEEGLAANQAPASSFTSNYKRLLSMFARNFYKMKYLALILAFLINFLMMFYKARMVDPDAPGIPVEVEPSGGEDGDDDPTSNLIEVIMMDPDEYYIEHILKALAFIHSIVSFGMVVAYYVLKVPLVIFKREKEVARKLEFQGMWIAEQPSDDDLRSHWDKLVLSTPTYPEMYWDKFIKKKVKSKYAEQFDVAQLCKLMGLNPKDDQFNLDEMKASKAKPTSDGLFAKLNSIDWNYQIWKWGVIFTDNSFLYIFWYFCFSVIGNFNYFFFACHLLDVAISIKSLTTILKSITHNGKQLILTIMLMSIIVYLYTVIAFNFFRKFYTAEEDGEVEENCQDLFTCFKFHLYIGIRSGGGIGDELESPVGDDKEFYRIIFDITFFFFIIVILLAIIQGLIIDAFGELRDQLEQVKETLEAACFICGISKDYFDKMPHGFELHTMREHNFANYMFFIMHLINKPDTEYTGQETYVWQQYQQRCWEFFPAGDCFRKQNEVNADAKAGESAD